LGLASALKPNRKILKKIRPTDLKKFFTLKQSCEYNM